MALTCRQLRAAKFALATVVAFVIGTGIFVSSGCSKSAKVTQPITNAASPAWEQVREDPAAAGEWLLANPINDSELAELEAKPTKFHLALVDHVFQLKGVPKLERDLMVADFKSNLEQRAASKSSRQAAPAGIAGACDQPVEYRSIVYGASPAYQVRSWNSANGLEYTFYFWPDWTDNSDDIRWASAIGWVTYCIVTRSWFSNGGIAGHHLCARPYELQLGDGVMKAIGFGFRDSGVRATYASVYLHHQ